VQPCRYPGQVYRHQREHVPALAPPICTWSTFHWHGPPTRAHPRAMSEEGTAHTISLRDWEKYGGNDQLCSAAVSGVLTLCAVCPNGGIKDAM
jgi:hypothetical protein